MSIVFAPSLVLARSPTAGAGRPVIGWHNVVTFTNVSATSELTDYPATNLGNSSTSLQWRSDSTAVQYVTVEIATGEPIDYVAVARHNFGSAGISVAVEGLTAEPDADWTEIFPEYLPATDRPLLLALDEDASLIGVRLRLEPDAVAPRASILYVGTLLEMEKGVAVGHVPLPYARRRTVIAGRSEGGEYLGKIESGGVLRSAVTFNVLTPDFYREQIDPFVAAADPFFFAWAPISYPQEVGFAWFAGDVIPTPTHAAGFISLSFEMEGLAL
jgi:hypothetical protein